MRYPDGAMTVLTFTLALLTGAFSAGLLGALTGLGGGVVIVPLLVLLFGVDFHYAIGASLVSVIATSSGAAAAYVSEGFTNIRVGMFLEIATTLGALSGAMLAVHSSARPRDRLRLRAAVLGLAVTPSAGIRRDAGPAGSRSRCGSTPRSRPATAFAPYHVAQVPAGFSLMYLAGMLSGLLGIGSGASKCSPWTAPCACRSRSPRRRATS